MTRRVWRLNLTVHLVLTAEVAFAPAAISTLLVEQKDDGAAHGKGTLHCLRRKALRGPLLSQRLPRHRGQSAASKPNGVREADAPAAVPAAIVALVAKNVLLSASEERSDVGASVESIKLAECTERLHARARALDVAVVDDDVAERLGRVDQLKSLEAARVLVRRTSTVGILKAQNDVNGIAHALNGKHHAHINAHVEQPAHTKACLESLRGAVADGPAVISRAKWPRAFADMPVVPFELRAVFSHLRLFHVRVRPVDGACAVNVKTGGAQRLHGERRVPQLRAIVPLHFHSILGNPQVVVNARNVHAETVHVASKVPHEHVDHLVHGADVDVPRVLVLVSHVPQHLLVCPPPHERVVQNILEAVHRVPQRILQRRVWVVQVFLGTLVSRLVPVDVVERLDEDLRS
mmetsp:Transcript_13289/g.35247  ORF Transcript_13289/g.35247 Transcript_13289/m.35247 type:complete len:406 (-) Transcript_13289:1003-2220(-)